MKHIAIDSGKHTTKIVAEVSTGSNASRTLSFVSAIKEGVTETADPDSHIIEFEGTTYLVGSQAKTYMDINNSKNTILHKICIMTALALTVESGDKVIVAIGCPLDKFYQKDEKFAYRDNMLKEKKYKVTIDGKTKTFEIVRGFVFPENFGAVSLKLKEFSDETLNVVDIGGLNVNASIYKKGVMQEGNNVTLQKGGIALYEASLNALRSIADSDMKSKLENWTAEQTEDTVIKGVHKKIAGSADALKNVRRNLVSEIYQVLAKNGYDFTTDFYFLGGTSYILREEIKEKFGEKNCVFLSDDFKAMQFVNAEGFYKLIKA